MMKIILYVSFVVILIVLAFFLGAAWSYERTRKIVYQSEYKVNKQNLDKVLDEPEAARTLLDYLKIRHYFLARAVPDEWLTEEDDYGLPNLNNVKNLGAGKESGNDLDNYANFKERLRSASDK